MCGRVQSLERTRDGKEAEASVRGGARGVGGTSVYPH